MSCFVCIVLSLVDISLVSLLSPEYSGLFPQVVLLFFPMSFPFSFHIFLDIFVLPFWRVFVDFFIWVASRTSHPGFDGFFVLFGGTQFSHTLISLLHRLDHLTQLYHLLICKVLFDLFCLFQF